MLTPDIDRPTLQAAHCLLVAFSCVEGKAVESESARRQLQQALLLLTQHSDQQNFGICAHDAAQGLVALANYLKALGYGMPDLPANLPLQAGPVYIKFNSQQMSYYCERYGGRDRGVLVSCYSHCDEQINGTYGYLPLDLFPSEAGSPGA